MFIYTGKDTKNNFLSFMTGYPVEQFIKERKFQGREATCDTQNWTFQQLYLPPFYVTENTNEFRLLNCVDLMVTVP